MLLVEKVDDHSFLERLFHAMNSKLPVPKRNKK